MGLSHAFPSGFCRISPPLCYAVVLYTHKNTLKVNLSTNKCSGMVLRLGMWWHPVEDESAADESRSSVRVQLRFNSQRHRET